MVTNLPRLIIETLNSQFIRAGCYLVPQNKRFAVRRLRFDKSCDAQFVDFSMLDRIKELSLEVPETKLEF